MNYELCILNYLLFDILHIRILCVLFFPLFRSLGFRISKIIADRKVNHPGMEIRCRRLAESCP